MLMEQHELDNYARKLKLPQVSD